MEHLLKVPHDQEIDFLYSLIKQDPDFLQAYEKEQFADTPLHLAAGEGRTQLALEIQRLMPSFGRKMNADGFTPVDLALRWCHTDTVSALIKLNPELVRAQGREGYTPLHYAAGTDDVDMLAEFLVSCPDSICQLTIRGESAAHVAAKNGKLAAFGVLFGWLNRADRRQLLRWRDWKGNTVLHLAAYANQPEIMELLIKEVPVNDKNAKGLTALDIVMELPTEVNGKALRILHRSRAKRGSSISDTKRIATLAEHISSPVTIIERTIKFGGYLDMGLPGDIRNAILVVAVLIATATYQAVLSPPGGVKDQIPMSSSASTTTTTTTTTNITSNSAVEDGKVSMPKDDFLAFTSLNSISIAASLGMIFLVLPTHRCNLLLHLSLLFLMLSYMVGIKVTSPAGTQTNINSITSVAYAVFFLIISVKIWVLRRQNVRATRRLTGSKNFFNIHEVITLAFFSKYSCINYDG